MPVAHQAAHLARLHQQLFWSDPAEDEMQDIQRHHVPPRKLCRIRVLSHGDEKLKDLLIRELQNVFAL